MKKSIIKDITFIIIICISIICLIYPLINFFIDPIYNMTKESYIRLMSDYFNFYAIGILLYIAAIMYIRNKK